PGQKIKHGSQGDRGCHSSARPLLSLSRYFCPSIHHPPPFSLSCEFSRSNIEMIALSIDNLEDHRGWTKVLAESGCAFLFPIIADTHRMLAVGLAMLDHDEKDKDGIPLTATVDFSIGPDKRLKLSLFYLPTMAWNFDEILRVVDGQQLTAQNQLATPAEWQVSVEARNLERNQAMWGGQKRTSSGCAGWRL
uniref:Alkyl hydroperoxide reductase subunit C/ Thiol specific antioxidant domain-containing protein n=1 Tax=Oncorhynchus mykiss TaxID=8022 RepID=A0A8K9XKF2_ONCMY